MSYDSLVILGPTACGKTQLAVHAAALLGGEVMSIDSRMVYRHLNLGTGKDLDEYNFEGNPVPYHLIDLVDPLEEYDLHHFQKDFSKALSTVSDRGAMPVLCGGSGLYLQAVLSGFNQTEVPVNPTLRAELEPLTLSQLSAYYNAMPPDPMPLKTSLDTLKRAIRAIEIRTAQLDGMVINQTTDPLLKSPLLVGLDPGRTLRRTRIEQRLHNRLNAGMVDEVKQLLQQGIRPEWLSRLGLEYLWLTRHLQGEMSYEEMFLGLLTAIHQFAKRQMTWFRKMEREGFNIHWFANSEEALPFILEKFLPWPENESTATHSSV